MHKHQAFLIGQLARMGPGGFQRVAVQHHLGAKTPRALHFDTRREPRHHDHGAQSEALSVVGHTLRVVARAHGHHAARPLCFGQLREFVAGTAFLERGGVLQVFKFEKNAAADQLRQRAGFHAGRVQHLPSQANGGGLDIGELQHSHHCDALPGKTSGPYRPGPDSPAANAGELLWEKAHTARQQGLFPASMIDQAGVWCAINAVLHGKNPLLSRLEVFE